MARGLTQYEHAASSCFDLVLHHFKTWTTIPAYALTSVSGRVGSQGIYKGIKALAKESRIFLKCNRVSQACRVPPSAGVSRVWLSFQACRVQAVSGELRVQLNLAGGSGAGSFRRFPLPPSLQKSRGCSEKMDFLRCGFSRILRRHAGGAARGLQSGSRGVAVGHCIRTGPFLRDCE